MELMKRTAYILALAAAVACSDIVTYKRDLPERFVNQGAPAISAIYDIRDDKMDIPLPGGTLAQTLHIKGENLSNPVSITFNGLEADLEKCYCENKDSYVLIPRVIPEKVDNKLVYTTAEGSVTYEFPVTIPELSLVGLADEFALPGNSVQVVGDFFDLFGFGGEDPKATISIGNTPIQVDSLSETYMSVYIPEDTPDCSLLTFSWNDINLGPQMRSIPFRNTRWLLFGDFGTTLYWGNVNSKKVLTDGTKPGDPPSPGYKFLRFNMTVPASTWTSLGVEDNWPFDTPPDWEKWVFKFELCTASARPIPAYTSEGLFFQFTNKGKNVSVDFGGVAVNTGGKWRTFSFPLSAFAEQLPSNGECWDLAISMQTPVGWDLDFSIANMRIEPKEY